MTEKLTDINKSAIKTLNDESLEYNTSTFKEIVDTYTLTSEVVKLSQKNINDSLIKKGFEISPDAKLSSIPENLLVLPNMGRSLQIEPPNIGAVIDMKGNEYNVAEITGEEIYGSGNKITHVWQKTIGSSWLNYIFVDNDDFIYTGGSDNIVRKIDSEGNVVWEFSGHTSPVRSVVTNNDSFVYSCSDDKTIKKISPDGEEVWTFSGHTSPVRSVIVDNDGFVYSCGEDCYVMKINPEGKKIWSIKLGDYVNSVAVDNNGSIYAGCRNCYVYKINSKGSQEWSFIGNANVINSVAVDNNGYIYSGSADKTVRKISPSGVQIWSNSLHDGYVYSLALDVYGYIYSTDSNGVLRKTSPSNVTSWSESSSGSAIFAKNGYLYYRTSSNYLNKYKDNYIYEHKLELKERSDT